MKMGYIFFYMVLILLNFPVYYGLPKCCLNYSHYAEFLISYRCKIICIQDKKLSDFCLSCPSLLNNQPITKNLANFIKPFVTCKDFVNHNETTFTRIGLQWSSLKIIDSLLVFLIEARHSSQYNGWYFVGMTNKTFATINNLNTSESYQFRVTPIMSSGLTLSPIFSSWTSSGIETYISAPTNLSVSKFHFHKKLVEAIVTWNSSKEFPCIFHVYWMPALSSSFFQQEAITLPRYGLSAVLSGLSFEMNYTITVTPFDSSGLRQTNSAHWWFVTPSCLSLTGGNFSLCAPGPPMNISIHWFPDLSEAILIWLPPNYSSAENSILHYVVSVAEASDEFQLILHQRENYIVKKNSLNTKISNLESSKFYIFEIKAISEGGIGSAATIQLNTRELRVLHKTVDYIPWHYLIPGAIVVAIFILMAVGCHILRAQWQFKYKGRPSGSADVSDLIRPFMVPADKIKVLDIIGQGAFAFVHRGIYFRKNTKEAVAIKIFPSETVSRHKLLHEVKVLKSVGRHNYIVGLIGFTLDIDKSYLLLEYCKCGNLHSWLIKLKKELLKLLKKPSKITPGKRNECHSIKLCSYVYQVAVGMEFIASAKVIHRDLASRNILMCSEMHVKIGDFGLARDVTETNIYTIKTEKTLPVRWMAPESIENKTFSHHTDVWSFGVLMWEVFKFGKLPYPYLHNSGILPYLKSGNRLPKPKATTVELYDMMCKCWAKEPNQRPSFTELKKMLETIITQLCDYTIIVDK